MCFPLIGKGLLMRGDAWVSLFERIPTAYHDSLVVNMTSGAEVVIQAILHLQPEYMVLRGRTAGSTDAGRLFIVPLDQIDYLGLNRSLAEPEAKAIFGSGLPAIVAPAVPEPSAVPPAELPATLSATDLPVEPPKKPPQISKTIMLARLRARLAEEAKPADR